MKKQTTNFVTLKGSNRTPLANSRPAGPVDLSEEASITVRVRSRGDHAALQKTVGAIYKDKVGSRKYLTRAELLASHGADTADLDAIEHYAHDHNLVVEHRSSADRTVVLSGTLGNLLDAFRADVQIYHHSSGTYRGRRGEIQIPLQLQNVVTGVFGFDTRPKHRSARGLRSGGPGGDQGVVATEFAKRYNFPEHLDGTGQTIAIIELGGGFKVSDLKIFFQEIGTPAPKVSAVSVDHAKNHPTKTGADDGEVMLDIEVAGAVAPAASLAVYFAPNQGNGFFDAVSAAVHDSERNPSVVSISWGGPEDSEDQQTIQAFSELFIEASSLGITVCTAAGDHGVADLDSAHWDEKIHVDHPSCDPNVLSCGGTQIDAGEDVVWNDGTKFDPSAPGGGGWATGGGISEVFPRPAYQKDIQVVSLVDGKAGRGVPDIAMSATNYFTRVQGSEGASGGTSAVAPLMAALVALLNQGKKKNVGFLNDFLYANAAAGAVKDVPEGSGDNGIHGTIKGYPSRNGWDACTGLGTPDGTYILSNI